VQVILELFVLPSLGHASYLVGSEKTGEALILDPQRKVDDYLAAARTHDLRIRYGIDSHGHNDYLSGLAELAERQGFWACSRTFM
jgi:hydroxyacylglutathione hydrolase